MQPYWCWSSPSGLYLPAPGPRPPSPIPITSLHIPPPVPPTPGAARPIPRPPLRGNAHMDLLVFRQTAGGPPGVADRPTSQRRRGGGRVHPPLEPQVSQRGADGEPRTGQRRQWVISFLAPSTWGASAQAQRDWRQGWQGMEVGVGVSGGRDWGEWRQG